MGAGGRPAGRGRAARRDQGVRRGRGRGRRRWTTSRSPSRQRVLHPARAFGLRQDHAPAADRRASSSRPPATSCSTARDIAHLPPYQRPVNTVFQSYALFPHMTVAREHRLRPGDAGARRRPRSTRRVERDAGAGQDERARGPAARRSSRAASSSAWRWRARWRQQPARAAARRAARRRSTSSCARRCRSS